MVSPFSTDCGVGVKQNSKMLKEKIALIKEKKEKFAFFNLTPSSDIHHYNQRRMAERVNAYLKDSFGCDTEVPSKSLPSRLSGYCQSVFIRV